MVEELLPESNLEIVLQLSCIIVQGLPPQRIRPTVLFDGYVCRSKESAAIEPAQGRNELGTLKKLDEGEVVGVVVYSIQEGS